MKDKKPIRHGHQGNRKIARVKYKDNEKDTPWVYSDLMTEAQATRLQYRLRRINYTVQWTCNDTVNPIKPTK